MEYSHFLAILKKSEDSSHLKVALGYEDESILPNIKTFTEAASLNLKMHTDDCESDRTALQIIKQYLAGFAIYSTWWKGRSEEEKEGFKELQHMVEKAMSIPPKKPPFPAKPSQDAVAESNETPLPEKPLKRSAKKMTDEEREADARRILEESAAASDAARGVSFSPKVHQRQFNKKEPSKNIATIKSTEGLQIKTHDGKAK